MGKERDRIQENSCNPHEPWYSWGTYLTERQWGTVREDYSADGAAWDYFPHDHARSRAYRWGEDGLLGWSDRGGKFSFSIALWNGNDPILKERLFGLTNSEGNHGEDVKELYYFLDGLPSGAYMKGLYKYPQSAYPYEELVTHNRPPIRGKADREYELVDTGILDNGYWDVQVEYAKLDPEKVAIRVTVTNCGKNEARLVLVPQICYRNTWSWNPGGLKATMAATALSRVHCPIPDLGDVSWIVEGSPALLFTENETNTERLYGTPNASPYVKDAFHRYIVNGETGAVNPDLRGTKAAAVYHLHLKPGESHCTHMLLTSEDDSVLDIEALEDLFKERIAEADEFYEEVSPKLPEEPALVHRQAFAGLLWSKQFYHYAVAKWLEGDAFQPPPPPERKTGRNSRWQHVHCAEIISMPDTWEYPWFAAWDLAFHTVTFALIDSHFAKEQLILLCREWMMHPNGKIPAYEWALGDVNPPVYSWAAWRVYTIDRRITGVADTEFLAKIFHKLLLNFTWWVNQKDATGDNVFEGGFLGLDNIGIFDRNMPLEDGMTLEQSDGTSWMAMFCLQMLTIALELATHDPAYEDVASKFFEHFLYIAKAMNEKGANQQSLWDDEDGFFYDTLHRKDGSSEYVKVRSAVGIIPLFAISVAERSELAKFPGFRKRMDWFLEHMPDLVRYVAPLVEPGQEDRRLLSVVNRPQLERILERVLDEAEFLSDYGVRALSKAYQDHPYSLTVGGMAAMIDYEPGESTTGAFGGNSNWRGPIWMPINYLLIESLQQYDFYYGDSFTVEFPKGSGTQLTLAQVSAELEKRLLKIFVMDANGHRAVHDGQPLYARGNAGENLILFYEYFHGDTGRGVGASHQTGWTALIAKVINQLYVTAYSDRV